MSISKFPGAPAYDAAITAIARIERTRDETEKCNFSRDLYPMRAIINALDKPNCDDVERVAAIRGALLAHILYGVKEITVYEFNGMAMVFDDTGQQVSELQGRFAEKRAEIAVAEALVGTSTVHTNCQWPGVQG